MTTAAPEILEPKKEAKFEVALTQRKLPKLDEKQLVQAQDLSQKIDPSNAQMVLSFGEKIQTKTADYSNQVLSKISLADSGEVGKLLLGLQKTVQSINPSSIAAPNSWTERVARWFGPSVEARVADYCAQHEKVGPTLQKFDTDLGIEKEKAWLSIEQLDLMKIGNSELIEALNITRGALILATNNTALRYEEDRKALSNEADMSEAAKLKNKWGQLQRMDRRLYAIEASIALAQTNAAQMDRLQELLSYNAEVLNEARVVMIPAWSTQIGLAITALRSKDQLEVVNAFRKLTDEILEGNADLITEIESVQGDMQKRTFVAAEVIVRINDKMAKGIGEVLTKQLEAKAARDTGLKQIHESQERLAAAMRDAGRQMFEQSSLNISSKPASSYDITQDLLPSAAA